MGLDRRWRETLALRERRHEDLGGQVFTIFKFRTMRVDAERFSGAVWAQENDPRVTPLGRVLRKFRLDELPQLWNIIRGDMNIVGPRPERPSIVARLREDIVEYRFRHRVKPGLTGLAQINQHYDREPGGRAGQGAVGPAVHPDPGILARRAHHAAHRSGRPPQVPRLVVHRPGTTHDDGARPQGRTPSSHPPLISPRSGTT